MRKKNLVVATLAFLLGANLVLAGKPNTDDLANILVNKLNAEVQLTDSQKTVIKKRLQKQITEVESADKLNDSAQKLSKKKIASEEYQTFLDSILTNSQREQLNQKLETRKQMSK